MSTIALYSYHISSGLLCFDDELRYWVKPRFNDFLISVYDDSRWIDLFRMSKGLVAELCSRLRPQIQKQDTKYRLAIPVEIQICATPYKLAQASTLTTISEAFAIGRSTVGKVKREVVRAINP
jgi:hypothetical protein